MKKISFILIIICCSTVLPLMSQNWESEIVPIVNGRLTYVSDANNNRIPDYSNAGYKNGAEPIPNVQVEVTLSPGAGDRTSDIQAAIDQVGALTPDANGIRGAILLQAGRYLVEGTLTIDKDGVIIRGVGDDKNDASNTILYRSNTKNDSKFFSIGTGTVWGTYSKRLIGSETDIITNFVQVGSYTFDVADASTYNVGDKIVVQHPDSDDWLAALNYGDVGTHPDADPWAPGETETIYKRYIKAINGNTITIDAPVFMNLDRSLSQSFIFKIDETQVPDLIQNVGVEKLRVEVATNGDYKDGHCGTVIFVHGAENFWIDQVTGIHFKNSLIKCGNCSRGTIKNCQAIEPHNVDGGMRYNYAITDRAQLMLVKDNFSSYGTVDFTNGGSGRYSAANSGNVYLNNKTWRSRSSTFDNHVRWYTGNLFDSDVNIEDNGDRAIFLGNRGHWTNCGYGAAFCTAWNFTADNQRLNIQGAPTTQNFAIGCHGNELGNWSRNTTYFIDAPDAYYEGFNVDGIFPSSLYLAQLKQRLDPNHYLDINNPENTPVEAINLFNGEKLISIGNSWQLIESVIPADATNKNITWESSDLEIATVNNGLVEGVSSGDVYIRAISADGNAVDSTEISVTSDVFVSDVSIDPSLLVIDAGNSDTLIAIIEPENATNKNLTWSSDNPGIVTVENGVIQAVAQGSATITVTTEDGDFSATSFIMVSEPTVDITTSSKANKGILCYPNPVSDQLIIETLEDKKIEIKVVNTMGQVLYNKKLVDGKQKINFSQFPEGHYFIKTNTGIVLKIQKIN